MDQEYHLVFPELLIAEVRTIAKRKGTTDIEVLRKFIKLGLTAVQIEDEPGAELIIREGGLERTISLFS